MQREATYTSTNPIIKKSLYKSHRKGNPYTNPIIKEILIQIPLSRESLYKSHYKGNPYTNFQIFQKFQNSQKFQKNFSSTQNGTKHPRRVAKMERYINVGDLMSDRIVFQTEQYIQNFEKSSASRCNHQKVTHQNFLIGIHYYKILSKPF